MIESSTARCSKRITEPNTVHHLISRIAHRVFFLQDDERNDFVEMMRRAAEFTGIKLIGWCIMTNHFHILAILPEPEEISDDEVVRRFGLIHSQSETTELVAELARYRARGSEGDQAVALRLAPYRKMMFSISWFMKITKEWFSKDYNGRTSHKGTMWEATYTDRPVRYNIDDMSFRLSYIHLNPVKAGITSNFEDYAWSSLHAAVRGDALALTGLRLVYGEDCDDAALIAEHHRRMEVALEHCKRKRAREVALQRAAGYETRTDPLTDEAYVVQAAAHLEDLRKAGVEIVYENKKGLKKCVDRDDVDSLRILHLVRSEPAIATAEIIRRLGLTKSRTYNLLADLRLNGLIP